MFRIAKNISKEISIVINKRIGEYFIVISLVTLCLLIIYLITSNFNQISFDKIIEGLNYSFLLYFLVGFLAQLVDSTLGMGYGATSTSFLLNLGVPPAISSTGVHVAEMFTTGASSIAQHKFGNINKKLLSSLLIPGVIGSFIGSYFLANYIDGDIIKPYIAFYMIFLASLIIKKALKKVTVKKKTKNLSLLAVFGGFMDSVGGGGWGPIVSSTLIGRGRNPRYTIGSVNAAEFAVAFVSGITFTLNGGIKGWTVILGLILGGILASPLGAYLVNKVPRKPFQIAVGIMIILLSLLTLIRYFKIV